MKAALRGDRKVNPTMRDYRRMTEDEVRNSSRSRVLILDLNGRVGEVKVTSIKTWVRKPDVEVHCKHGMREYFTLSLPEAMDRFLVQIDDPRDDPEWEQKAVHC